MLELALVNRACRLPAFDAPQILLDRQRQQKVVDFSIVETTLKIGKFRFSPPHMLDDEVPVAKASVM